MPKALTALHAGASSCFQDFNEIDRSLADPAQLYDNLRDIKVIENWSLGREELSAKQHEYTAFMASTGTYLQTLHRFVA